MRKPDSSDVIAHVVGFLMLAMVIATIVIPAVSL